MADLKKIDTSPYIQTREMEEVNEPTGNIYESVVVVSKRANQINTELTEEIKQKLEEFGSTTDTLEEVHENTEQIEISKFYERMHKPSLLATKEFLEDNVYFRNPEEEDDEK
jgi:DNA-directed RNA polymerase subunit K/omega